jgi:hypothetical protein
VAAAAAAFVAFAWQSLQPLFCRPIDTRPSPKLLLQARKAGRVAAVKFLGIRVWLVTFAKVNEHKKAIEKYFASNC